MGKRNTFCLNPLVSIMRISLIQFSLAVTFSSIALAHDTKGQDILNQRITLDLRDQSVKLVFEEIETLVNVSFMYSSSRIASTKKISIVAQKEPLGTVLNKMLSPLQLTYQISGRHIVIKRAKQPASGSVNKDDRSSSELELSPRELIPENLAPITVPVSGEIVDDKGEPILGATVQVNGTDIGTVTDQEGKFSLEVPDLNVVLVVSYIGFQRQEIALNGRQSIKMTLAVDTKSLEDVVIVGYGTQKKLTNTGAQASMAGKLLVESPAANISNSLVGRLPGLFASQASGEPGNDQSTLRIRGVGTFNGSQEPLVLVDGIQVDNYNNLDPNEIENITILKDASSTAVYGIRGANGVLLITTKRGKVGPAKVSYTFNQASNTFTDLRAQMNSFDYANSFNQALQNDAYISGANYTPRYSQADLAKYKSGEDPIFFPSVNWYDVMLKKTSAQQQHNLSVNGGTDKVRYAISTGYFNQEGLFNNTNLSPGYDANIRFKRFNFRSNLNFNISKRFKAALDVSSQNEFRTGNALNTQTVIDNIARANPTVSPGIVDGKLIQLSTAGGNPLGSLYQAGYQREFRNFLNGSFRLDYDLEDFVKGLSTHAIVSYQNFNSQRFLNSKPTSTVINYIPLRTTDGSVVYLPQTDDAAYSFSETIGKNRRVTAEFALDYKRKIGKNHNVSALLLYNQLKSIDPNYTFLVPNGYQSYVGRATYDFQGRYLAEINIAYNGTENFAPGNRFGLFPAYSLGWVASEEGFFPKNDFLTLLKFRGSYGEVGNDQIGSGFLTSNNRFLYRPTAWTFTGGSRFGEVGSSYNVLAGSREGRGSNADLTWERAVKTNLGVEMTFWKKNITLNVDLFEETRDNILANPQTVSSIIGVAIPPQNLGKMQNRGYEFDFTLNNNIGALNYQIKANYSFARNEILFQDEVNRAYPYQFRTGNRFGQYFGLLSDGFFNTWDEVNDASRPVYGWQNNKIQPGDIRYKDVNGDGKVNFDDEVPIGFSQVPEKTFGLSVVLQFKGFSASVLFQGVDNVSVNYTRRYTQAFYDANPASAVEYLINSWTPERYAAGLPIVFPRFSLGTNGGAPNNYQSSDFFTVDASYVRLKNAELGYTFSGARLKRVGFSSIRVFVNGNNLVTWSSLFPGVDPESPPTVTNFEPYPLVRTINTGINVNF